MHTHIYKHIHIYTYIYIYIYIYTTCSKVCLDSDQHPQIHLEMNLEIYLQLHSSLPPAHAAYYLRVADFAGPSSSEHHIPNFPQHFPQHQCRVPQVGQTCSQHELMTQNALLYAFVGLFLCVLCVCVCVCVCVFVYVFVCVCL